jgi:misacylated tRNA(Ala) deacylase
MTDLLCHTDAYVRAFAAAVAAVDAAEGTVVLDRTAFYPGGGGQPCDVGWLTKGDVEWRVAKVRKKGKDVVHRLEGEGLDALQPGDAVTARLDWDRRHLLMRTHTALHVLCGVVWRDYGAQVTGGNMEPGKGRMDFEFETLGKELVGEIEASCNAEVAAGRDVHVRILPREEAFRIPDLIRTKSGTHVANTREVGRIHVTDYKSKGAINKRIYIAVA